MNHWKAFVYSLNFDIRLTLHAILSSLYDGCCMLICLQFTKRLNHNNTTFLIAHHVRRKFVCACFVDVCPLSIQCSIQWNYRIDIFIHSLIELIIGPNLKIASFIHHIYCVINFATNRSGLSRDCEYAEQKRTKEIYMHIQSPCNYIPSSTANERNQFGTWVGFDTYGRTLRRWLNVKQLLSYWRMRWWSVSSVLNRVFHCLRKHLISNISILYLNAQVYRWISDSVVCTYIGVKMMKYTWSNRVNNRIVRTENDWSRMKVNGATDRLSDLIDR